MVDLNQVLDDIECNDCGLSEGIEVSCERSPGGNLETIYIINKCQIENYDDSYTDNVIDAINLTPGAVWFPIQTKIDTLSWEVPVDQAGGFYTQNITFNLDLLVQNNDFDLSAQKLLDFVNTITNPYNNFVAVITHNNGRRYVFGLQKGRGLKNGGGSTIVSGATLTDPAGATITLTTGSTKPPFVLSQNAALPIV